MLCVLAARVNPIFGDRQGVKKKDKWEVKEPRRSDSLVCKWSLDGGSPCCVTRLKHFVALTDVMEEAGLS